MAKSKSRSSRRSSASDASPMAAAGTPVPGSYGGPSADNKDSRPAADEQTQTRSDGAGMLGGGAGNQWLLPGAAFCVTATSVGGGQSLKGGSLPSPHVWFSVEQMAAQTVAAGDLLAVSLLESPSASGSEPPPAQLASHDSLDAAMSASAAHQPGHLYVIATAWPSSKRSRRARSRTASAARHLAPGSASTHWRRPCLHRRPRQQQGQHRLLRGVEWMQGDGRWLTVRCPAATCR